MRLSELGSLQNIGFLAGRAGDTAADTDTAEARMTAQDEARVRNAIVAALAQADAAIRAAGVALKNAQTIYNRLKTAANLAKVKAAQAALDAAIAAKASAGANAKEKAQAQVATLRSRREGALRPQTPTKEGRSMGTKVVPGQPAAAPPRTPATGTGGKGGKGEGAATPPARTGTAGRTAARDSSARMSPPASGGSKEGKGSTVTVLTCPAGQKLDSTGKRCVLVQTGTKTPDSTTQLTEEQSAPPVKEPVSIQVTTPGDSGGGGGSYGPPEPQYAPPEDFLVKDSGADTEKMIDGKVVAPPGTQASTGSRDALYVGGALVALGIGSYLAYKKFKSSGERT